MPRAQTYLNDAGGAPVYSGNTNIAGYNYNIAASSFSNNVYDWNQTHLAQAVTLKSGTRRRFRLGVRRQRLQLSRRQSARAHGGASRRDSSGGAGTINRLNGTGWYTLDAKGVWTGWADTNVASACIATRRHFAQIKYNTANWIAGAPTSTATDRQGPHRHRCAVGPGHLVLRAANGRPPLAGAFEDWRAYDGYNYSASPALNVNQPKLSTSAFSPKASLAWAAWQIPGRCPPPGAWPTACRR